MEEENFTDMNTSPEDSKEKSVEARDANNIVLNIIPESEARLATITTEAPKPRPFTSPKPVAMRSQRHFFNIFRWPDKEARVQTSSLFTPLELQMAGGLKWTWVRRCVLAAFWLTWISLLASALVIIVRTPECKLLPRLRWWQRKPMYRIAMQSYYDTNGDGFGDLLGIQRKIEYIQKLHVGSIIIMPFNSYKANSTDLAVNERFGHIQDLKSLLKTAARSEIKVILDLTPNPALIDEYFWANIDFRDGDMLEWLLVKRKDTVYEIMLY
ncbi:4F2 cell-surface antigen heavy chain-like [Chiloscyllium plagiosum]|uniref:4F2 cell-surface antigen heavy chain-like n=1 Tax=Chiloscyllium plagiosum TaxID=36176 RepID=UPI001CB7F1EE|nr:4F2 cell-surface antigen heavy chain-like [Chiloscyllium plagiosum]